MELDCRTALILRHPSENQVLLLKRAAHKKLFPNLITGIGGKVEMGQGEDLDLEKSLLREFKEETKIDLKIVSDIQLKLSTIISRDNQQVVIFWFVGNLKEVPSDLACNEGGLGFYDVDSLPLQEFTSTAASAIPFILSVKENRAYNGVFDDRGKLIVNKI